MQFAVQKAENCFANAQNYEYRLPLPGQQLLAALKASGLATASRVNEQLRRPSFTASLADGTQIRGLLAKDIIKVGYPPDAAAATAAKASFEAWLAGLE